MNVSGLFLFFILIKFEKYSNVENVGPRYIGKGMFVGNAVKEVH